YGAISGSGSLIIGGTAAGGGTLTTLGMNTYTGSTSIAAVDTWISVDPVELTYANTISGTASFIKSRPGTLTLTATSTYSAGTAGFMDPGEFSNGSSYAFYDTSASPNFIRGINYGVDAGTQTTPGTTSMSSASGTNVQMTGDVTAQATDTFSTINITGTSNLT